MSFLSSGKPFGSWPPCSSLTALLNSAPRTVGFARRVGVSSRNAASLIIQRLKVSRRFVSRRGIQRLPGLLQLEQPRTYSAYVLFEQQIKRIWVGFLRVVHAYRRRAFCRGSFLLHAGTNGGCLQLTFRGRTRPLPDADKPPPRRPFTFSHSALNRQASQLSLRRLGLHAASKSLFDGAVYVANKLSVSSRASSRKRSNSLE